MGNGKHSGGSKGEEKAFDLEQINEQLRVRLEKKSEEKKRKEAIIEMKGENQIRWKKRN